jgi:hypothetical protein
MSDTERDRTAMQFAITVTRAIEGDYPEHAGVREGEATSDVLKAILVRLERDAGAVEEAEAALRWIASNADVPHDFRNWHIRLVQIRERAKEALIDIKRGQSS